MLAAVASAAILIGIAAGRGLWFLLPAVALIPLFWRWPVQMALGGVALLLPFEGITLVSGGTRGVMSIAFVVSMWVVFAVGLAGGRLQKPSAAALWCGGFIAWSAATLLWAVNPAVGLDHLATVVGVFLFFLVVSSLRVTEKEFDWLMAATLLGGMAAALYSLYQFRQGLSFTSRETVRATLVSGDTYVNPNRFAIRLLLPLAFALAYYVSARSRLGKILALSAAGLTCLTLLFIESRGTLIAAGVLILVFTLRIKMLRTIIPIALLAAAMVAATPAIIKRFQGDDRGAGRYDIWLVGLKLAQRYPMIGAGLSNFPVVYTDLAGAGQRLYMRQENDSHNIYLEVAVEQGVIGLFLFTMALVAQFVSLRRARRRFAERPAVMAACEAAFCSLLVAGLFGNILWDKTFWLSWTFLAFVITLQLQKAAQMPAPMAEVS